MVSLDRFDTFKAVVEAGSLTAAADLLGQTRAVVSFNIKRLEAELGVTLLIRNTRRLALTVAGERFYVRCLSMLEEARLAIDEARSEHTELKGTLRITTTVEYALAKVVPALELFRARHPELNVHLSTSSTHADLISERFDVALRLGRVFDSSHRAVQLRTFEILPVASPGFVASLEPINCVQALEQAPWLEHGRVGELSITELSSGSVRPYQPNPANARIKADNSSVLQAFALTGQGVAILPDWLIEDDLQAGRLVHLLPGWQLTRQGIYALYPDTRHLPLKVRVFIDFMKTHG
ncbi:MULTISPECIES: LysR family transcriptional regulator [unclassified Pseudomonas]|uniref:LysR family transcriptional regulator n=1 Tax=unclassified Pseudomonas TaxID=196821 RepID=UPI0012959958|nr:MULTISPECIES: LysR family transcriptional regulator [unclassified Pseudomonas]MDU7559338.1 LysR family transcriptional regulator [Pseudomonas sp.]MQT43248.1 LysR family transcriptional regulator [Pseudomonas sp. FSL R10-0765]MQT51110.1 LysR family transcriptional regulator [Pseudomonas sp. FSL R10-2398]MQU01638.1 LysR family transcriptional regulator [Pseudomonas sp. FSL R10-2245]MQU10726.1 LysR family transcriptional regulator [Pseudomonas sp. FSL R10-2189]